MMLELKENEKKKGALEISLIEFRAFISETSSSLNQLLLSDY